MHGTDSRRTTGGAICVDILEGASIADVTLDHDVVARDAHEMTALRCEEADTIGMITLQDFLLANGATGVFGDVHAPALVIQIFLQLRDGVLRVFEFAFSVSVSSGELGGFLLAEVFQVLTTPGLGACRAIGIQLHEVGRDSATTRDDLRAIGAHHGRAARAISLDAHRS